MTVRELMRVLVDLPDQNLNITIDGQEVTFVGTDQVGNSVDIETDYKETVKEMTTEEKFNLLPENIQGQIRTTLNSFRFSKVHEFMEMTNWTWWDGGVPPVYKLRWQAKELLVDVCYSSYTDTSNESKYINYTLETGGFFARACDNGNKVELRFSLESYGNI